jgi:hypothetical protein
MFRDIIIIIIITPRLVFVLLITLIFSIKISGDYALNVLIFMTVFFVNESRIICITETWLNDSFYNHRLFPNSYSVFRAARDYTDLNLTRGGGVLIAVHHSIS